MGERQDAHSGPDGSKQPVDLPSPSGSPVRELEESDVHLLRATGRQADVVYLAGDPSRNEVSHSLDWNGFWYPLIGSLGFMIGGVLLFLAPSQAVRKTVSLD